MINMNTRAGPLDYSALRNAAMERREAGRPSQMNLQQMQPAGRPTISKAAGAMPPSVGRSGSMGSDSGSSLPIRGIAQALMNSNGNAFGGARVSGRNSLANMPGLQEGLARRRMQQPTMAPQQPQQPVQFTQPRVHAQGPGGVSSRWMELFRG